MKKIALVLVALLVATSVFAGFTAGVSAGYDRINGDIKAGFMSDSIEIKFKKNSVAASVNVAYEHDNGLVVFDDFSFIFGKNAEILSGTDWIKISERELSVKSAFKNNIGLGYKFTFNSPVELMLGVSYVFTRVNLSEPMMPAAGAKLFLTESGIGLNAKVFYNFADNFRAFANLNADFNYTIGFDEYEQDVGSVAFKNNSFSFNFGAKLGVAYSF